MATTSSTFPVAPVASSPQRAPGPMQGFRIGSTVICTSRLEVVTAAAGDTFLMYGGSVYADISGILNISGTPQAPVTFTSYRIALTTAPAPGDCGWYRLPDRQHGQHCRRNCQVWRLIQPGWVRGFSGLRCVRIRFIGVRFEFHGLVRG